MLNKSSNIARHSAHLFKPTQIRNVSQRGCPTYCTKDRKMDTFQHLFTRNIDSDPTGRLNKDGFMPVKVDTLCRTTWLVSPVVLPTSEFLISSQHRLHKMTCQPLSINISHIRRLFTVQSIL